MKEIMKRAWEIYKYLEGDRTAKLSMALKQAWAEHKNQFPKLEIADWFILKTAREQKWSRDSFFIFFGVMAIVGETQKAYKVIYHKSGGFVTFWVPKSVCKWETIDRKDLSTKTFAEWKDGMAWSRDTFSMYR